MTVLRLAVAALAVIWGMTACVRRKQPLFYKILLFGCASYLLGALFEACWVLVYRSPPQGFHIGYLGYMGAYFFLLSAYFGAIDRLADGGERVYRPYRLGALLAPLAVAALCGWSVVRAGWAACLPLLLPAIPVGLTLYFAVKHLILPDVDMGIIRVMRPYNACVILLCLCQLLGQAPLLHAGLRGGTLVLSCLLLAALLPLAELGVRKWFI